MSQLLEHPLWSFLGVLIGVVGVALAVFFYVRGRRLTRLSYSVKRLTIFGENVGTLPGLSISCGGRSVSKLFDYRILIWNSGSEVVHPSDFASSDPLRIQLGKECNSVVGVNILAASSAANRVTAVMQVHDQVCIDIEYLGKKQGVVLSLLSDSELLPSPRLEGVVKGGTLVDFSEYRRSRRFLLEAGVFSVAISLGGTLIREVSVRTGPLVGVLVGSATLAVVTIMIMRMVTTLKGPACDPRLKETFGRGFHEWEL